jgi:hypothetical protein
LGDLTRLSFMADQASACNDDIPVAIASAGLGSQYLAPWTPTHRGSFQARNLTDQELIDAFRYLVEVFRIADARRRVKCGAPDCYHWWHQDLGNEDVLREVRSFLESLGQRMP